MSKLSRIKSLLNKIPLISKIFFSTLFIFLILNIVSIYLLKNTLIIDFIPRSAYLILIAPLDILLSPCFDRWCDNAWWFEVLFFIGIICLPLFWAALVGSIWTASRWVITGKLVKFIRQHKKVSLIIAIILMVIVFWLPWQSINYFNKGYIINNGYPNYKYIIVFGGVVKDGEPLSEINRERLLAAKFLANRSSIAEDAQIIVSNNGNAAEQMKQFLINEGIDQNRIQVDTTATTTADTCHKAVASGVAGKAIVFVSHGYHLPRLMYQCKKIGLHGFGFAAESINSIERTSLPWWQKIWIRTWRYSREAGLSWLAWLNIYQ